MGQFSVGANTTGGTNEKLNELYPQQYPQLALAQSLTRAQVYADLVEARRTGDMIATGGTNEKLNELYPLQYPQHALAQGKTRQQVAAELIEARREAQGNSAGVASE